MEPVFESCMNPGNENRTEKLAFLWQRLAFHCLGVLAFYTLW
jgi:hypothetical protein